MHIADIEQILSAFWDLKASVDLNEIRMLQILGYGLGISQWLGDERKIEIACDLLFEHDVPFYCLLHLFGLEREAFEEATNEESKRRRIQDLKALPYDQYLKTEHWRVTREAALLRDANRCRVCNSSSGLNVHHRTYERLGEERPDDLTTLCQPCHEMFHANGKLARPE